MKTTLLCVLCIEWTLRSADDLSGLNPRTGDYQARIFNLMYELQTIQRPSASLLIGARAR